MSTRQEGTEVVDQSRNWLVSSFTQEVPGVAHAALV